MTRILVVEDQENWRDLLGTILSQDGHEVTHVSQMRAALDVLRRESFDLVVTDASVDTDGDGWVLARQRERALLPVVLVTGSDFPILRKGQFNTKALLEAARQAEQNS